MLVTETETDTGEVMLLPIGDLEYATEANETKGETKNNIPAISIRRLLLLDSMDQNSYC